MDLLDRYMTAVAFWLPSAEGRDVTAELREDIRSEIESREDEMGRPLSQEELEVILTRWGHPMRVAGRYLPSRSLIGPALLPVYTTVLKVFASIFCAWLLILGGLAVLSPAWSIDGEQLFEALEGLVITVLCVFAVVTALFAAAERSTMRARRLDRWTAAQLSRPDDRRDRRRISRLDATIELAIGLAVFAWWTGAATPPESFRLDNQVVITWAPFPGLYAAVTALMAAGIAMSIVNVLKPRWTIQRLGLQMAVDSITLIVVLLILPLPLFSATPLEADPAKVAMLVRWANVSWTAGLAIAAIVLTFSLYGSYRKLAPESGR